MTPPGGSWDAGDVGTYIIGIVDSDGRTCFDRRVTEGKTNKEAIRALKRHISNAVYRQLLADNRR